MNILSVSAGIILYKPDTDRLMENINRIYSDIEHIYIYNNGSSDSLLKLLEAYSKIVILGDTSKWKTRETGRVYGRISVSYTDEK